MADTRPGRFDVEDDPRFQKKFWTFQRASWVVLFLILGVAIAGLTGQGGRFAHARISSPTAAIDYPRVTRWEASDDLTLTLVDGGGGEAAVEISSAFSEIFEVEDIQPAPSESYATAAGQRLVFDLAPPQGLRKVTIHVRAMRPSLGREIGVRVDDGPVMRLRPIVLP